MSWSFGFFTGRFAEEGYGEARFRYDDDDPYYRDYGRGLRIDGTRFDDWLVGTPYADLIRAGDGADLVEGLAGDDSLAGQEGPDDVYGDDGRDTLAGGDGRDFLDGGRGHDDIFGGQAADTLYGHDGDDFMTGDGGPDDMFGERGDDTLYGDHAADWLHGGPGDDLIFPGTQDDTLTGGPGFDTGVYDERRDSVFIERIDADTLLFFLPDGSVDRLEGMERAEFADGTLEIGPVGADAAYVWRLYDAVYDRPADDGLDFWVERIEDGMPRIEVAEAVIESPEYDAIFGEEDSFWDLLGQLYETVLERPADREGRLYWQEQLAGGMTEAEVLVAFTESGENIARTEDELDIGLFYIA